MKNNRKFWIWAGIILALGAVVFAVCQPKKPKKVTVEYTAKTGSIKVSISTTGTVQPQNRLAINPPMAGRVEKVLVVEGQHVKTGQTLAYMSSADRAAIIDAARAQGEDTKEWEDIYKLIPLVAPINGEVIVQSIQPGQTVSTGDAVVVLSDRLIIQAQVDETDIGKVKLGQKTNITLDAYPDRAITGTVDHIYYESKLVNNVTIYNVDILPDKVPAFFRSGMSANIDIIQQEKENVVLLPLDAVRKMGNKNFVFVKVQGQDKPEKREVVTGISDDESTEIASGLSGNEVVVATKQNYTPASQQGTQSVNPFMPARPKMGGRGH